MTWAALIPIVIQYGLPVAERLWQLWSSGSAPTTADWDSLKALGASTRRQDLTAAPIRNGVHPASPQGQALIAVVA